MLAHFEKEVMQEGNGEITGIVSQYGGWLVSFAATAWVGFLRWALGRYVRQFDAVQSKLNSIDNRLSVIEGRFTQMDHNE